MWIRTIPIIPIPRIKEVLLSLVTKFSFWRGDFVVKLEKEKTTTTNVRKGKPTISRMNFIRKFSMTLN